MYNIKLKRWESDCSDPEMLKWSKMPENSNSAEAQFIIASELLTEGPEGEHIARAMWSLQFAVDCDYAPAVFAMAQIFDYGWGAVKNKEKALKYYHQADDLGFEPARQVLAARRRNRFILFGAGMAAAVMGVVIVLMVLGVIGSVKRVIKVNPRTELTETTSLDEFNYEIQELIKAYDDDLVVSGQVSTNRVILKFDGNVLDLRDFLADKVVVRENNIVIIQFSTEEEARKCIEQLTATKGIQYAEMDQYHIESQALYQNGLCQSKADLAAMYNGHYSWGAVDMHFDDLVNYLNDNQIDTNVVVAVIDEGTRVWPENQNRILDGWNVMDDGPGTVYFGEGHGTHVSGTILDCTKGTDVKVLPIDIYGSIEGTNMLAFYNAIQYAIQNNVDVINMSQGLKRQGEHWALVEEAIGDAYNAGIVFVNAAGNSSFNTIDCCFSCQADKLVVVAAKDQDGYAANFSCYGDGVDVCAPGVDIYSENFESEDEALMMMGTSMAAPHVAALAALARALYPDADQDEIEQMIRDSCHLDYSSDLFNYYNGTNLADTDFGVGTPDARALFECN